MILLGFRAAHGLKPYQNVTHSYFVLPNEGATIGSITFFSALLKQAHIMGLIAICAYRPRTDSRLKIVALAPQVEGF